MHAGAYWQVIYWFSTPILAVLAILLFWRRLNRDFPLFTAYTLAAFLSDVARLVAYQASSLAYTYTYWTTQAVVTALALLVIYDLCLRRLFAAFYKVRFYRFLFPAVALIIGAVAVMTIFSTNRRMYVLAQVIHVFDVLQVAILLFLVGLMIFMGRRWSRTEFGIAMGFGVDAAAYLVTLASWTKRTPLTKIAADIPTFSYDLACLIWLVTFLKPEKTTPAPTQPVSSEVLKDAKKWQETLKGSLTGKKPPD